MEPSAPAASTGIGDRRTRVLVRSTRRGAGAGFVTRLFDLAFIWLDRVRQRRHLAELSDHLLHDVGISRTEVEREIAHPFWRAEG